MTIRVSRPPRPAKSELPEDPVFANNRILVALPIPSRIFDLIGLAKSVVDRISTSALFPSPSPAPSAVNTAIADLEAAELQVIARVRGSVATRNEKRAVLVALIHGLKAYVQHVADSGDRAEAAIVITTAGMNVAKSRARVARQFGVRPGELSGSVEIYGKVAARRAAYEWEASGDGGKTWKLLPVTMQSKTSVSELVPGSTWWFRYRPVTRLGEGDWSQVASIIVR
jgi:hypothetical protein